ncbi:hypothetical protein Tco_1376666 [Tanacetum coccineum]
MQTQIGQLEEAFQERPLGVLPSNTETYPREERKAVTTVSGLTLYGSFIPQSNFLVYQEKEQEPETITEVVEIASSQSTPLVSPLETSPLIDIVDSLCDKFPIENNSLSGNSTPSFDLVVESLSLFPIPFEDSDSLMEETDTLLSQIDDYFFEYETFCFNIEEKSCGSTTSHSDLSLPDYEVFCFKEKSSGSTTSHSNHSLPEYESFCFDHMKEKSSGSTTTHSDYSLPDYDAFYFDDNHIEEKCSGSTTTHSDFSLPKYDLFIFDLLIDLFPPVDMSAFYHEEFVDELTHIISPPEYDYFYFDLEANPGEFTRVLKENIFDLLTKGLAINELNDSSLILSDCDSSLSKEFSEIELLVSFPSRYEDIIFDPEIFIIKRVQSERFHILPLDDFSIISFISNSLLLTDPPEIETFLPFPVGNEDKVFDPGIFFINGVFSFTRKTPHLLNDNFLIDKCHNFIEISLMTESSISFHPKDKEIRGESS